MPVLLMARGDEAARDLLKKAIAARYGVRPIVIDTLKLVFAGRVYTSIGPLKRWVPLDATAAFRFPDAMRWDYKAKAIPGIKTTVGTECYDGNKLYMLRASQLRDVSDDALMMESAQRRLWAMATLLLMPLSDHFVQLRQVSDYVLVATNTQLDVDAQVHFDPSCWIDGVSVNCVNPETRRVQRFSLRIERELVRLGDVLLPKVVRAYWDDTPWYELMPQQAVLNEEFSAEVFSVSEQVSR